MPKNEMSFLETKMRHINQNINASLTCDHKHPAGNCTLNQTCESFPELWEFSFELSFNESDNNMIIPLATFARRSFDDKKCELAIKPLMSYA